MQYLKKEVRDKIIEAAVDEFKQQGFADASIRNIAQTAETSLGNIYRYFSNKEALFLAVINPVTEDFKQLINERFSLDNDTLEEIPTCLVQFILDNRDRLLIVKRGSGEHYESFINQIVYCIADKMKQYLADNYPQQYDKIANPDFFGAISSSFVHGVLSVLNKRDSVDVVKRNVKELLMFFFSNLAERFNQIG